MVIFLGWERNLILLIYSHTIENLRWLCNIIEHLHINFLNLLENLRKILKTSHFHLLPVYRSLHLSVDPYSEKQKVYILKNNLTNLNDELKLSNGIGGKVYLTTIWQRYAWKTASRPPPPMMHVFIFI